MAHQNEVWHQLVIFMMWFLSPAVWQHIFMPDFNSQTNGCSVYTVIIYIRVHIYSTCLMTYSNYLAYILTQGLQGLYVINAQSANRKTPKIWITVTVVNMSIQNLSFFTGLKNAQHYNMRSIPREMWVLLTVWIDIMFLSWTYYRLIRISCSPLLFTLGWTECFCQLYL